MKKKYIAIIVLVLILIGSIGTIAYYLKPNAENGGKTAVIESRNKQPQVVATEQDAEQATEQDSGPLIPTTKEKIRRPKVRRIPKTSTQPEETTEHGTADEQKEPADEGEVNEPIKPAESPEVEESTEPGSSEESAEPTEQDAPTEPEEPNEPEIPNDPAEPEGPNEPEDTEYSIGKDDKNINDPALIQDSYIDAWHSDNQNGSSTNMKVLYNVENNMTLMKFDITAIPQGAQIQSASLNLYLYEMGSSKWRTDGKIEVHKILPQNTWNESSVSWDERLSDTPWESHDGGEMYEEQYADEGYPKIIPSSETLGWKKFSIKDAVQDWIDGQENNGLVIFDSGLSQNLYFYSKDYEDEALRPYLEVSYVGTAPDGVGQ